MLVPMFLNTEERRILPAYILVACRQTAFTFVSFIRKDKCVDWVKVMHLPSLQATQPPKKLGS